MKKYYTISSGFSLIEVLISLVLICLMLIMALPLVERHIAAKRANALNAQNVNKSAAFYYTMNNKAAKSFNDACFLTETSGTKTIVKNSNGACEIYDFTVPQGVYKLNMTLVAGGGGGGGASGSYSYTGTYSGDINNMSTFLNVPLEMIKDIKIKMLTGAGSAGKFRNGSVITSTANAVNTTDSGVATDYAALKTEITNTNVSELDSDYVTAGTGGNSAVGIIDFTVPESFYKYYFTPNIINAAEKKFAFNYTNNLNTILNNFSSTVSGKTYIRNFANNKLFGLLFNGLESSTGEAMGIFVSDANTPNSNLSLECFRGKTNSGTSSDYQTGYYEGSDNNLLNTCGLTNAFWRLSTSGKEGKEPRKSSGSYRTVSTGYIVKGGEGGEILGAEGNAGKGGRGSSVTIICADANTTCTMPGDNIVDTNKNPNKNRIKEFVTSDSLGNNAKGKTSITYEYPAGIGGGGAGGAAVKINNFSVIPGTKYKIVVGKGGAGGRAGLDGSNTGIQAQNGENGTSGTSTAIFDANNNLVVMVIGGVGGKGGKTTSTTNAGSTNVKYNIPSVPDESRYIPLVLFGSNINNVSLDSGIISEAEPLSESEYSIKSDLASKVLRLVYKYLKNDKMPFFELNSQAYTPGGTYVDRTTSANYKTLGGFARYTKGSFTSSSPSTTPTSLSHSVSMAYPDIEQYTGVYHGLFFRNIINGTISYPGGNGGFSGLGSKGGCGGFFVGNSEGYKLSGSNFVTSNSAKNAIAVKLGQNTVKLFNINNLYSGCSTSTPNGHQAKFINPVYSPDLEEISGAKSQLGQAGSGGGGGGWNSKLGSGSGGDGQNGYVFITWY